MAWDSYLYYPSFDYSMLGSMDYYSLPPPNPDHDLLDSSIFNIDYNLPPPNLFLESSTPNSISPVSYSPYPIDNYQPFQLDFDHSNTFFPLLPSVQEQFPQFELVEPKRQKCDHSSYNYEFLAPQPQAEVLATCVCRNQVNGGIKKSSCFHTRKKSGTRASIAARERRKKISDKTQELGKLLPGPASTKMNTADMLHHAYNYVKFLQAQVSVLELIDSKPSKEDGEEQFKKENLRILETSAVQEKLFMKGMCLVPMDFIENLAENEDVKSQGSILKDLKQLMQSVENC